MITSHPKNRRRKCINPISENTITATVVNGFILRFLSREVVSILHSLPVELFTIISGLIGEYFTKKGCSSDLLVISWVLSRRC
jgi:hypothetical protein